MKIILIAGSGTFLIDRSCHPFDKLVAAVMALTGAHLGYI
jgi:hypothetical protein